MAGTLSQRQEATMNTANLQLGGLYVVISALLVALREKGVFEEAEIDCCWRKQNWLWWQTLICPPNYGVRMWMRSASRCAFLRQALQASSEGRSHSFIELSVSARSAAAAGVRWERIIHVSVCSIRIFNKGIAE
jgi:hypothetical protein